MTKFILVIFLFATSLSFSQDERIIKDLFNIKTKKIRKKNYSWISSSPLYSFDFTDDGLNEKFKVEKRDGEDWLIIYSHRLILIKEIKLDKIGLQSYPYRLTISHISTKAKVLILHFYQGFYKYINFYARSKLYFLTFEENNIENLKIFDGPAFWVEKESFPERYQQRFYKTVTKDLNNDGVKEIIVSYQRIKYIYKYLGRGKWKEY